MEIDLELKEVTTLLYALGMYKAEAQKETRELIKIAESRQTGGCIDFKNPPISIPYWTADEFICELRDKLKKFQMKFPLEEHPEDRRYDYGDKWGII